jgi:hypothetical protein
MIGNPEVILETAAKSCGKFRKPVADRAKEPRPVYFSLSEVSLVSLYQKLPHPEGSLGDVGFVGQTAMGNYRLVGPSGDSLSLVGA